MTLDTIDHLFDSHGFTPVARYADYSVDAPFGPDSEKMIAAFTL